MPFKEGYKELIIHPPTEEDCCECFVSCVCLLNRIHSPDNMPFKEGHKGLINSLPTEEDCCECFVFCVPLCMFPRLKSCRDLPCYRVSIECN
jgi:hypothetical protein